MKIFVGMLFSLCMCHTMLSETAGFSFRLRHEACDLELVDAKVIPEVSPLSKDSGLCVRYAEFRLSKNIGEVVIRDGRVELAVPEILEGGTDLVFSERHDSMEVSIVAVKARNAYIIAMLLYEMKSSDIDDSRPCKLFVAARAANKDDALAIFGCVFRNCEYRSDSGSEFVPLSEMAVRRVLDRLNRELLRN